MAASRPSRRTVGKFSIPAATRKAWLRPTRLGVELLEDRVTPAAAIFDGDAGDGDWNNALNWMGDTLPQDGDDVTIGVGFTGSTVTFGTTLNLNSITSSATFDTAGGALTLNTTSSFTNLRVSGYGNVTSNGTLTITGNLDWDNGTLGSGPAGKIVLDTTAVGVVQPFTYSQITGGTFEVDGSLTLQGNANLGLSQSAGGDAATLRVFAGATLALDDTAGISNDGNPAHLLENFGTITHTGGGESLISPNLDSTGNLWVLDGTLNLVGGGSISSADLSGNGLSLTGGTLTLSGSVTGNAPLSVLGGGTLSVDAADASVDWLVQNGGTITGPGNLTVNNQFDWMSGEQRAGGKTILAAGGTGTITAYTTLSRTLEVEGTLTYSGTVIYFGATDFEPGVLRVLAGGTLELLDDGDFLSNVADPGHRIENYGTITRSGTGISYTDVPFFQYAGATLTSADEAFQVGGGGELAGGTISGLGLKTYAGTFIVSGDLVGTGPLTVSNTSTLQADADGGSVETLVLEGGQLLGVGSGDLTVTGTFDWLSGSTRFGGGNLLLAPTSVSTLSTNSGKYLSGTIEVAGTLSYIGQSLLFGAADAEPGILRVVAGGELILDSVADISTNYGDPGHAVEIFGTVTHPSAGAATIFVPFMLFAGGTINTLDGDLQLSLGGTFTGGTINGNGVRLIGDTVTISGDLFGDGPITVASGGTLETSAGSGARISELAIAGGIVTGPQGLTVLNSFDWSSGIVNMTGGILSLDTGAIGTLTTDFGKYLGGEFEIAGTLNYTGTQLSYGYYNGAPGTLRILAGGTLNIDGEADFSQYYGDPNHLLENFGTITHTGIGTVTDVGVPFVSHDGSVLNTIEGTVTTALDTQLNGGDFQGSGLQIRNGTSTVAGALTGNLELVNGAIVSSGGSVQNLIFRDGSLGGSGDLTITGGLTWEGGDIIPGGSVLLAQGSVNTLQTTIGKYIYGGVLEVAGTLDYAADADGLNLYDNAGTPGTLRILNTGVFHLLGSGNIGNSGPANVLENFGTIAHTGAGTSIVYVPLISPGVVNTILGTIQLNAGGTLSGGSLEDGGITANAGILELSGAYTGAAGIIVVGSSATVRAGAPGTTLTVFTILSGEVGGGADALTVLDTFDWQGGSLTPGGKVVIDAAATGTITSDAAKYLYGGTLEIAGTVDYTGTGLQFYVYYPNGNVPGVLRILAGGAFHITGDGDIGNGSGAGHLVENFGTFTRDGLGNTNVNVPFSSSGTVNTITGTLNLTAGGGLTGGTLQGNGIVFDSGDFTLSGIIAGTSLLSVTDYSIVDVIADTTLANLDFLNGEIGGLGNLTITNLFDWTGGTLRAGGKLILPVGATGVTSSPDYSKVLGRTIDIGGTFTYATGSSYFSFGAGPSDAGEPGVLNVLTTGTLVLDGDQDITAGYFNIGYLPENRIENRGTVVRKGLGDTILTGVKLVNYGTVDVQAGNLLADFGGELGDGTLTGAGNLVLRGGLLSITGDTTGVLTSTGGEVVGTGLGSLETLNLDGGEITGGDLTITTAFYWLSGNLRTGGDLILPTGSVSTVSGGFTKRIGRRIRVAGDFTSASTSTSLNFAPSPAEPGEIQVEDGGIVTINDQMSGDGTFTVLTGGLLTTTAPIYTTHLNIAGGTVVSGAYLSLQTVMMSDGLFTPNDEVITPTFTLSGGAIGGSGLVRVTTRFDWQDGELRTGGNFLVDTAATFDLTGLQTRKLDRVLEIQGSFSYSGAGLTLDPIGGTSGKILIRNSGSGVFDGTILGPVPLELSYTSNLEVGTASSIETFAMTHGSAELTGAGNLTVTGRFTWTGGNLRSGGQFLLAPGATGHISGVDYYKIIGRVFEIGGDVTYSDLYLSFDPASTEPGILRILPGGTLTIDDEADLNHYYTNAASLVDNQGTIIKTGPGISTIGIPFTSSGTIETQGGVLEATGGVTLTGGTLLGLGLTTRSNVDLTGDLVGTGPLRAAAADLIVTTDRSIETLALVGAELTGPGNLTVTRHLDWADATARAGGKLILPVGATGEISGYSVGLNRIMEVGGELTFRAAGFDLDAVGTEPGTLHILPTGHFILASDGQIDNGGQPANLLWNEGRITKIDYAPIPNYYWDQGVTYVPTPFANPLAADSSLGQSFTPGSDTLNLVEFRIDTTGAAADSTLVIDVFDGIGFAGTLLGTSDPITIPAGTPLQNVLFYFAAAVPLTPGTSHTLRVRNLAGGGEVQLIGVSGPGAQYTGGSLIDSTGTADLSAELYFQEGTVTYTTTATTVIYAPTLSTGTIDVQAGVLQFPSNLSLSGELLGSGIDVVGGVTTLTGDVTGPGTLRISGSTVLVADMDVSIDNFRQVAGEVNGAGVLTVANHFDWESGTIRVGGKFVIGPDAIGHLSTSSYKFLSGQFEVAGELEYDGQGFFFGPQSGDVGILRILPSGTFTITTTETYGDGFISPWYANDNHIIENLGEINFVGSTHVDVFTSWTIPVVSTGAFNVPSGKLSLQKSGTFTSLFIGETGTLEQNYETLTLNGNVGGTGGAIRLVSGFLHLPGDSNIARLILDGGEITGPGNLTVTDQFTWNSGFIGGTGKFILADGATGTLTYYGYVERDIDIGGSFTIPNSAFGTGLIFDGRNGQAVTLTILSTGLLEVQDNGRLSASSNAGLDGVNQIINFGTLRKTGAGQASYYVNIISHGAVEILQGSFVPGYVGSSLPEFAGTLTFPDPGYLVVAPGATLRLIEGFSNTTQSASLFAPQGHIEVSGGVIGTPELFEVMSRDLGNVPAGFNQNFVFGTLEFNGVTRLVDTQNNAPGASPEAIYVDTLIVNGFLDLNLFNVYARNLVNNGTISGGTINSIPDGGPIPINTSASGSFPVLGEVDNWTFYARPGDAVTIFGDPGDGTLPDPLDPAVESLTIRLLDPNGVVVAEGTSLAVNTRVDLLAVLLTVEGTYTIEVSAGPDSATGRGNYLLSLYNARVDVNPLVLNQPTIGSIETQFAVDRWTFRSQANQQLRLDAIAAANAGIRYKLTGPNGFIGFTDLGFDSDPTTLPFDGEYTLEVYSDGNGIGAYRFKLDSLTPTVINLGDTYTGALDGPGFAQLFQVNVPTGNPLAVILDADGATTTTEIYLKLGAPPTRNDFDFRANGISADHFLQAPFAAPGTWFILVYTTGSDPASAFTLRTVSAPVVIQNVSPAIGGTGAPAVLTINGAGFVPGTTVELVDGANVFAASDVGIDSFSRLTADLDLGPVPAGTYDVRVTIPGGATDTLIGGFVVEAVGAPNLETRLIMPEFFGRHALATIYVEYENTGTAAMAAPILTLQSTDADNSDRPLLTLDQSILIEGFWGEPGVVPAGYGNTVQIYAGGSIPGILQPGERVRVPVYYIGLQTPWDFSDSQVEMEIRIRDANDATPIDWASMEASLRPAYISPEAWTPIFANLTAGTGGTWGEYIQMLSENASYLSRYGQDITDVNALFGFEFLQATGLSPVSTVASAIDASLPTPGLSLEYGRSFGNTIAERYQDGPFGRGWSAPAQPTIATLADGTAVLSSSPGSQIWFAKDSRGASAFFSPEGYTGTLRLVSGIYTLTDSNGTVLEFNANGSLNFVQDANGNRVTYGYTTGRLTTLTHSSGASLTFTYNAAGRIASIADSAGRTTTYGYDATDEHLVSVTKPSGTTTYTYSMGNGAATEHALTSETGPGGVARNYEYDANGRLIASYLTGNVERVDFTYGPAGRVTATDSTGSQTILFYDHRGLILRQQDGAGNYTKYEYGADNRLSRQTDSLGRSASFEWCDCGNLSLATDQLGNTVRYTLGGTANKPTGFIDSLGNTTTFSYDARGNRTGATYSDGSIEQATFDATGNPTQLVNRRGQTIGLAYNANGQVTQETYSDGSTLTYAYDAIGRLTTATDSQGGVTVFTYDAADRLTNVTYPSGRSLSYSYDAGGRRTQMTDNNGYEVNYSYDAAGRMLELSDASSVLVTYSYDAAGRLSGETKGNGTSTTYSYDAAGRVASITHLDSTDTATESFSYSYDAAGRRTEIVMLDGSTWDFTYDLTGQLTRAILTSLDPNVPNQDLEYVYDSAGNRVRTILNGVQSDYATNNLNQYTTAGGTTYTYDADGNLTRATDANGTTNYSYDVQNRVTRVDGPQGVFTYEYDAFGNRSSVTKNGVKSEYLIDLFGLESVVSEFTTAGARTASYTHGLGLESVSVAGSWNYYEFDALGSTSAITDATGAGISSYSYDPFGGTLFTAESFVNPFQFVGETGVMNDTSGSLYMRARQYDPLTGRFTTVDPIGLNGDSNLYRYTKNSPTNATDPLGLFTLDIGISGGFGIGGTVGFRFGSDGRICFYFGVGATTPGVGVGVTGSLDNPTPGFEIQGQGAIGPGVAGVVGGVSVPVTTGGLGSPSVSVGGGAGLGGSKATGASLMGIGSICTPEPPPPPPGPPGGGAGGAAGGGGTAASSDPNEKTGAAGFGTAGYIRGDTVIPYRIKFENLGAGSIPTPTQPATAPAQRVEVTDQLSADLDWSTVRFTEVGFGDTVLTVPSDNPFVIVANGGGSAHYFTTVFTTINGSALAVEVELSFDPSTGMVRAVFQSLDSATGLPPDVLSGFLPPEDGTGRGQGYFSFNASPRAGLASGTEIRNIALIRFDGQTVIATNQIDPQNAAAGTDPTREALNTLDNGAPTSAVDPLPAVAAGPVFTVDWTGTDDAGGSGIASFDVFVRANGGAFTLWLDNTTATTAEFTGTLDTIYEFYTVAIDNVGFVQPTPVTGFAMTRVPANTAPTLPAGSPTLRPIADTNVTSPGDLVSSLIEGVTDPDAGQVLGAAVVGLTGSANGTWQFSLDDGTNWTPFPATSAASATVLLGMNRVRFVPNVGFTGNATVVLRAWDGSTGTVGGTVNLSGAGTTGGETAFSATTRTATIFVSTSLVVAAGGAAEDGSGWQGTFTQPFNPTTLNLFDVANGSLGNPDIVLVGPNGQVLGSVIVSPDNMSFIFVPTGGPLAPGDYTLTLRSAANGFVDVNGTPMDGNADGTPGGDFVTTFTVVAQQGPVLSLPDVSRGAGQVVNVPANGTGLPVSLTVGSADAVTDITFDLVFNPSVVTITGAVPGADAPAGSTVGIDLTTPGIARITFHSDTSISDVLNAKLIALTAQIPDAGVVGDKTLLDLQNLVINAGAITGATDDGVLVIGFIGDTNGTNTYTGVDASLIKRLVVGIDGGLVAFPLTDAMLLADINGDGRLTGVDASLVSRRVIGLPDDRIPNFVNGVTPAPRGPDPVLAVEPTTEAEVGEVVEIPVAIAVPETEVNGATVQGVNFALGFDPQFVRITGVRLGPDLEAAGFRLLTNIDNQAGTIIASASATGGGVLLPAGYSGVGLILAVEVQPDAPIGTKVAFDLKESIGEFFTSVENAEGTLPMPVAPTNAPTDPVDGELVVVGSSIGGNVLKPSDPFALPGDDEFLGGVAVS